MKKQIILVTGASSGIGKACARQLISEGHTVYCAARRVEQMQDLKEAGGRPIFLDVTQPESAEACVTQILEEESRIDVLLNNAGYAIYGAVEDIPLEEARRQFDVNLFGLAAITRAVLPQMRERRAGRIINMSSMGGKIYTPLGAWYHATKHALEGWSDCLRLELNPFGIDVVIIEPGAIETEFGDVMLKPMLERSAESPYRAMTQRVAAATQRTYDQGGASPASVIAKLVSRAIAAPRPKTRYSAGKFARPLMFMRQYFPDRFFDKVIMSQVK